MIVNLRGISYSSGVYVMNYNFEYWDDYGNNCSYEPRKSEVKEVVKELFFDSVDKSGELDKPTVAAVVDYLIDDLDIDIEQLVNIDDVKEAFKDKAWEEYRDYETQRTDDWAGYESAKGVTYGRL